VFLLESALCQEAGLARPIPYVLGPCATEPLVPHGQRPFAPASPIAIDVLRRQVALDAPLAQLMTDFQRTVSSCGPLQNEVFRESLVRQEVLGLERIQRFADEPFGKSPSDELAIELGA
jgi:hypothetical protein